MRHEKETAQRRNAGGKVNHRRSEDNTAEVRGASGTRRFGPNLGEAIILALALGAAVRTIGRGTP